MLNAIKHEFIYRFDPCHAFLRQALRTALSAILALILYNVLLAYPERYWAVLAAAFIVQTRVGHYYGTQLVSIVCCGFFAAVLTLVMASVEPWSVPSAFVLAVAGMIYVKMAERGHFWIVRCFFIFLFGIISVGIPVMPGGSLMQRFSFVLLGTLCALVAGFFWRRDKARYTARLLSVYEHNLAEFIFQGLVSLQDRGVSERRFHERRNRILRQYRELKTLLGAMDSRQTYIESLRVFAVEVANLRFFDDLAKGTIADELCAGLYPKLAPLLKTKLKPLKQAAHLKPQGIAALYLSRFDALMQLRASLVC